MREGEIGKWQEPTGYRQVELGLLESIKKPTVRLLLRRCCYTWERRNN
jgi:hypothetical protein